MSESKMIEFLSQFKDDVRHPIVADSYDWDNVIRPALAEFLEVLPYAREDGLPNFLLTFVEAIYCRGYQRGKNEQVPQFVVGEE